MTSTPNFERRTQTQALHVRIANELPETLAWWRGAAIGDSSSGLRHRARDAGAKASQESSSCPRRRRHNFIIQFSLIHYRNPHYIADAGLLGLYVRGRDSCRQHDDISGLRDLLGTYQFDGSVADIFRGAEFYGF